MSDSSPFDYDPPAAAHHEEKEEQDDEEGEEEEEEEDDPFADVDKPSSSSAGPAFSSFSGKEEVKEQEETPLSIWEKERAQILAERKKKAEADKAELLAKAKEELNKFYADASTKLEKTKKVNRADEKNFRNDTAEIFKSGTKWEKVNRLVNVQPKTGEKPGTSRVDRYRKLLIQLKTEKPKAAAHK